LLPDPALRLITKHVTLPSPETLPGAGAELALALAGGPRLGRSNPRVTCAGPRHCDRVC